MTEIRHFTDDDRPIRIEISPLVPGRESGLQETTRGGNAIAERMKEISDAALFEAFRAIYKVARKTELLIGDLHSADSNNATPLSGAEVEFGIKFDQHLNAVITSGVEATITVKLTWGKVMTDTKVVHQALRDFTVQIRDQDNQIAGTGFVISDDGIIVTCAHVIRNLFDGKTHPRTLVGQTVNVYFPNAHHDDKRHSAKIECCFPQHDDDIVLLKLEMPSPVEPGKYARIYTADRADGHRFRSFGFRRLDKYDAAFAWGEIGGSIPAPEDETLHAEPLQLDSKQLDRA